MKVKACVRNRQGHNDVVVTTNERSHSVSIPPKAAGRGADVNGAELLFLALATCYCNDLYREAAKRNISIDAVEVEVEGEFGAEGEPARHIAYRASVESPASEEELRALLAYTDTVAEIHNTLRAGTPVILESTRA